MSSSNKMWTQGPFNIDHWKKKVNRKLPLLIKHLNPQEILPYLPTLTSTDKEEVICRQQTNGKTYAAQALLNNLERRPGGYRELMYALMEPDIDLIPVALEIDPEFAEKIAAEKGIDINDYIEQDSDDEELCINTFAASGALSPEKTPPGPPVVQHYHQYGDNSVMTVNPVTNTQSTAPTEGEELSEDGLSVGTSIEYTVTETDDSSTTGVSDITDTSQGQLDLERDFIRPTEQVSEINPNMSEYNNNAEDLLLVEGNEPSQIESGPKENQASLNENTLKNIDYSISCDSTKQTTVEGSDTFDETSAKSVKLSNPQEVAEGEESEDPMVTAVKESSLHTVPSSTDTYLDKVLAPVPPSVSLGTLPPSRALDTTDLHKEVSQSGAESNNFSGVALSSSDKENNSKTTEPVQNKDNYVSSVGSDDTAADSATNMSSGSSICGSTESSGTIIINGYTIIVNKRKRPEVPKDRTAGEIQSTERSEGGFTGEDDGLQAVGDQKVDRVETMTARPMGKNRLEENVKCAPVSTADIDSLQDCTNPPPQQNLSTDDKGIIDVNESVKVDDIGVDNDLVAIPTENHDLKLQAHGNLLVKEEQSDEVTESSNVQAPTILVTSPTDESRYISSDTEEDGKPLHPKLERESFSLQRYPEEEENENKNVINDDLIEKPFSSKEGNKDVDHTQLAQLDNTKVTPGGEPMRGYTHYLIFGGVVILGFYAVWKYTKKSTIN